MAPLAIAAVMAYGAYKSADSAKKAAAKGSTSTSTETSTREPYGPSKPYIDDILNRASALSNEEGPRGPMPYAWQNFMSAPESPGTGADPTYGGTPPNAGGGGGAAAAPLTWRGKDQGEVRAAKAQRQEARTASRNAPAGAPGAAGAGGGEAGVGAPGASQAPAFKAQSGPFGYSQGLRDYMMQQFQGQGAGGYQPALQYIQGLLGGQSQNPMLSQAFERASSYKNPYLSNFPSKSGGY